ncbi:hypothetical protein [Flavobacterium yafengii]|uniref:hypothetical protein n=1 Tax=Flavobacterium yafengii TaxID=3041253 RepID=UPI0024A987D3|nr:hypothetical protein [Flavobacterium yafengii]MDI6047257.1 hypothetical protein [Flavobacterium yafengii]
MIETEIHFKDYDLALPKIQTINVKYRAYIHLTRSVQNGLLMTIEVDEKNLDEYLKIIESFGLETY